MNTPARYIILVLGVVITLHYILSFTHEEYGRATSLSSIASHLSGGSSNASDKFAIPEDYYTQPVSDSPFPMGSPNSTYRANATFVVLARNSDTDGTVRSIREMEDRFNRKFGYPYVLLNDEPFTDEFKKRVSVVTSSKIEFGLIPKDDWNQPDWIDEEKAKAGRDKMVEENIIYGGRAHSFLRAIYTNVLAILQQEVYHIGTCVDSTLAHELVQKYRYYWRIEPDVHFHCDIDFDPFVYMKEQNKTYGFTVAIYEFEKTIPTLWSNVTAFTKDHPEYVAQNNAMGFLSDNGGDTYNLCHFWSNFEIADLDFWRGPAYTAFFDYLDKQGGFYYERWGDAPVHSIAASLFLPKDQIHFFNEIGYEHNPYTHCPRGNDKWTRGKCSCDPNRSFDYDGYSCMRQWDRLWA